MKALCMLCLCTSIVLAKDSDQKLNLVAASRMHISDPEYAIKLYIQVLESSQVRSEIYTAAYNCGILQMESTSESPNVAESLRIAGRAAETRDQRRDVLSILGYFFFDQVDINLDESIDLERIETAMNDLKSAEGAFLDAARSDPTHMLSKRNVERVRLQIQSLRDIRDQINQQEQDNSKGNSQQSNNGNEQSDSADKLQNLADNQREQAQESESTADESNAADLPSQDQRSQSQSELTNDTTSAIDELSPSEDILKNLLDSTNAQRAAEDALEKGDNRTAAQMQHEAADALERAVDQLRESQDQSDSKEDTGNQAGHTQPVANESGKEKIDEIAQQLLDKERREREQRQAYRAQGKPVVVEEDW